VIVNILPAAYLIRPLGVRSLETVDEAQEIFEENILQKVGELDFDTVHENDEGFGFSSWAVEDLL